MTSRIRAVLIVFFLINSILNSQEQLFIPQPESVKIHDGFFSLTNTTKVYFPKKYRADLQPYILTKITEDVGLKLKASNEIVKGESNFIQFKLSKDKTIENEGYHIISDKNHIVITGRDYGGLFNGFQTLRQTFPLDTINGIKIPSLEIKDKPRFAWRGIMLDVSRHFQPKDFVLKQIDVLSSYKINKFHWHLTDDQGWRIEIKKYPNLTQKGAWRADRTGVHWWSREKATAEEPKTIGGYYTQEEIKEVISYAKVRNVEVIPEIDIPGHSKALIAAYPNLWCHDNKESNFEVAVGGKAPDNAVCAGKETSFEFLEDVIDEIANLFPSSYLHIGGDECNKSNWKTCIYCQKVKSDFQFENEEELQSYFIRRIHEMVKDCGKIMIGWDEVLSGFGVPGATIMAWRRGKYTPETIAPQKGHPTIMTSYRYSYLSQKQGPSISEPEGPRVVLPLSKVYSHEPIPDSLTAKQKEFILGNQACLWGEFLPNQEHYEYMLYPRALASAEVSWTQPTLKNWERFQNALVNYHYDALSTKDINVSKSMFSVYPSFTIDELHNGEAIVYLQTEMLGQHIFYTLDGSTPTNNSTKYENNFRAPNRSLLKAGLFNNEGILLGKIVEVRLK